MVMRMGSVSKWANRGAKGNAQAGDGTVPHLRVYGPQTDCEACSMCLFVWG